VNYLLKNKIEVKKSFFVIIFFMFFLGYIKQFAVILIMVTIHELSHILAAKICGLNIEKIIFTPIGEIAVINNIERTVFFKRIAIVLAGPLSNMLIALYAHFFNMNFIRNINFSIALFNLLPIYPLDGGRILQYIISKRFGVIFANKLTIKISYIFCYIFFVLGIFQLILFNYNISFLCIGIYLIKINKREYLKMTFEFYKSIINKKKNDIIEIKHIMIDKNVKIKNIISKLCWDYYFFFYIAEDSVIKWQIDENDIIDYIQQKGLNGNICDIIKEIK